MLLSVASAGRTKHHENADESLATRVASWLFRAIMDKVRLNKKEEINREIINKKEDINQFHSIASRAGLDRLAGRIRLLGHMLATPGLDDHLRSGL